MAKRFKTKKNGKKIIRIFLFLFVIVTCYFIISFTLSKFKLSLFFDNHHLIKYTLKDVNHHLVFDDDNTKLAMFSSLFKINLNKPVKVLKMSSYYLKEVRKTNLVYNENYEQTIPVIKEEIEEGPLVYIYNTHPTETYLDDTLNVHNIEPNIRAVSDVLKNKLEEIGVPTVLEQGDVSKFLKENNYDYNDSYTASRYYLEQFLSKNSSVKLYIDLHRDGVSYENSVATIDGKKYAKVMFVLGGASKNYNSTLDTSKKINSYFEKNYKELTRGIFERKISVYNQDLRENMVLIELGGNENYLVEIFNTIDILAEAIKEYVYEN